MRVHIDGKIFGEASHILGWWNGFAEPVFTHEEMVKVQDECVRLGYDSDLGDGERAHLVGWQDLGNDEWLCRGWVWEVAND